MSKSDYHRIEKAIRHLSDNASDQPSLKELAASLGMSEFHCHRLFRKWAGITPKDFLQFATLARAKALLAGSRSLMDASHEAGLSGSSRLHDLFVHLEAMTPGEFGRGGEGLEIAWETFESPLGRIGLALTPRGICWLGFHPSAAEIQRLLHAKWPNARLLRSSRRIQPAAREINARVQGRRSEELPLLVQGTPFQVKVWEALLKIPEGSVTTYRRIAEFIGQPTAVRAVGTAVGANPIGYLIPCHRVIRSTGVIGDYHWGSERKTALLAIEGARAKLSS